MARNEETSLWNGCLLEAWQRSSPPKRVFCSGKVFCPSVQGQLSKGAPFFCGVRIRWPAVVRTCASRTSIVGGCALAKLSRAAGGHVCRRTDGVSRDVFWTTRFLSGRLQESKQHTTTTTPPPSTRSQVPLTRSAQHKHSGTLRGAAVSETAVVAKMSHSTCPSAILGHPCACSFRCEDATPDIFTVFSGRDLRLGGWVLCLALGPRLLDLA